MLPTRNSESPRLADVLQSSLAALSGTTNPLGLPAATGTVVVLVDGLGSGVLRSRIGHARFLATHFTKRDVIDGVFPSTTAAAIATLTTGEDPGTHGLVGYAVRDAAGDRMVNQLTGWDAGMDPARWQRVPTIFERARDAGVPAYSIGPERYADSGFTQAVLRGAQYIAAASIEQRFAAARRILDTRPGALIYLYVPELDQIAHAKGWESDKWLAQLEALDAATAHFASEMEPGEGMLLTADHGVLDVPATKHVLFDTAPQLVAGVRHIGGEPRCLQLYLEPDAKAGEADALAAVWRSVERDRAWVATRAEAIEAGWFGDVHPSIADRIGDVIVAARKKVVYYDSRIVNTAPRKMIGQHGSLSEDETRIPLLRFGIFAR